MAIDVFTRGLKNTEIRTVIKAQKFETLSEAIVTAKEEALLVKDASMYFSSNQRGRNGQYRGKFERNGFRGKFQYPQKPNFNNNYNRNQKSNTFRGRNNFRRGSFGRPNNFRSNTNSNRQSVNFANVEQRSENQFSTTGSSRQNNPENQQFFRSSQ